MKLDRKNCFYLGLYRKHMVPDRQGSAVYEISNHWISPSITPVTFENLHSSLSSSFPRDVIESACKNSSNSILPSPLSSNTLNTNLKDISMDGKWVFYSLGKCGRITRWEKLIVDFWKFATSESSCRTIFHETLMPMLYFNRCNLMKFLCDRGRYMWQCENVTYSTSRVLTAKFNLQSHSP